MVNVDVSRRVSTERDTRDAERAQRQEVGAAVRVAVCHAYAERGKGRQGASERRAMIVRADEARLQHLDRARVGLEGDDVTRELRLVRLRVRACARETELLVRVQHNAQRAWRARRHGDEARRLEHPAGE